MTISDGAVLPLSGVVNNSGIVSLNSIENATHLQLIQHGITLEGGGQVILSDSGENFISGTIPLSPLPIWTTRSLVPASSGPGR